VGFITLAILIVVMPMFPFTRPALQWSALLIASAGFATNAVLQRRVLNDFSSDPPHSSGAVIIDIDRVERLA
jgi:hypothetical protein